MYIWCFIWRSGTEQEHNMMAGWLLSQQREQRVSDCSFPGLDKCSGKASSHFPPWEGPLKFIAHNVLLAVGWSPGNFGQMKLAMLQWFRLQWPRLQGDTEWNGTLCNMVSGQWHGDHDGNVIKHPWTSNTNQDWYWTGYQELQNCSQCSTGCR